MASDDSLYRDSLVGRSWLDRLTGRALPMPAPGLASAFLGGGLAVIAVAASVAVFAATGVEIDASRSSRIVLALGAVTTVSAVVVFAMASIRWTLNGERAVLWAGIGALTYGVVAVSLPEVVGPVWAGEPGPVLPSVAAAGQVTTFLILAAGVLAAVAGYRWSMRPLVAAAAGSSVVLTMLFYLAPGAARFLATDRFGSDGQPAALAVVVVVGAWLALGAAYVVWGIRHRWLYGWCGLLTFSLTLAHLARAVADDITDPWWIGGAALAATGMTVAATLSAMEMAKVSGAQGARLFRSEVAIKAGVIREMAEVEDEKSRHHEVANALLAIEGAAAIIERHAGSLDDDLPFREALRSGTERLRAVIAPAPGSAPARGDFTTRLGRSIDIVVVAESVARDLGWQHRVSVEGAAGVMGDGAAEQLAEVIRLLLVNADQRDPSGPISIRAAREPEWAVLRVDDRGPDLTLKERRSLAFLGPSPRGAARAVPDGADTSDGAEAAVSPYEDHQRTFGMVVAARLMRSQGGDLWAEPRDGGGCTFAICLPSADSGAPVPADADPR